MLLSSLLVFVFAGAILWAALAVVPNLLISESDLSRLSETTDKLEALDSARGRSTSAATSLIVAGSLIVALAQLFRSQRKDSTDRLANAVEGLGSKDAATRTGSLYLLSQLGSESRIDSWHVNQIIASFVRGSKQPKGPWHPPLTLTAEVDRPVSNFENTTIPPLEVRRPDLHAALQALGSFRAKPPKRIGKPATLLDHVDGQEAILRGLTFRNLSFARSNYTNSTFHGNRFIDCTFYDVDFSACDFDDSSFQRCDFQGCTLVEASFTCCILKATEINQSDLTNSVFDKSSLYQVSIVGPEPVDWSLDSARRRRQVSTSWNVEISTPPEPAV